MVDAGLDLGKTVAPVADAAPRVGPPRLPRGTRCCCRRPTRRSSARSSTWRSTERGDASMSATALGVARGCRIVRAHDVRGTRRVVSHRRRHPRGGDMTAADGTPAFPAYLVKGDDPGLAGEAVRALVRRAGRGGRRHPRGRGPRCRMRASGRGRRRPDAAVPGGHRVVIVREVGRFLTAEVAPLVAYLADPLPTTRLVLVGGGGQVSPLAGRRGPQGRPRRRCGRAVGQGPVAWLAEPGSRRARSASTPPPATWRAEHLGEDVGRLATCSRCWPPRTGRGPASVSTSWSRSWARRARSPRGTSPTPSTGATLAAALTTLHRMMAAGGRHPLVVLATLHTPLRPHAAPRRRRRHRRGGGGSAARHDRLDLPGQEGAAPGRRLGSAASPGPSPSWPTPTWS